MVKFRGLHKKIKQDISTNISLVAHCIPNYYTALIQFVAGIKASEVSAVDLGLLLSISSITFYF
jgi:hypothetical protein